MSIRIGANGASHDRPEPTARSPREGGQMAVRHGDRRVARRSVRHVHRIHGTIGSRVDRRLGRSHRPPHRPPRRLRHRHRGRPPHRPAASTGSTGGLRRSRGTRRSSSRRGASCSEIPNPDNWNIYAPVGYNHQREMGLKGIYEALFYTNLNTGELIPWQGESYTYNADFTQITLKLRDGVTWCDGEKFTADDVKYTLEMLRDNSPDLLYSAIYKEYLKDVTVVDPLTAQINLTKPARGSSATTWPSAMRTTRSSCRSTSGRARTRRRSRTSTSPRTGRAAPARTTSCSRPRSSRSPTSYDKWWGADDRASRRRCPLPSG